MLTSLGNSLTLTHSLDRRQALRIGKREVDYGRVRLRKWVETEPVTEEVELRRGTAFVERQPVNRPASGAEIGEQEVEMPLHREEPVVSEEIEEETVHGEVRRERVEVEDDSENTEEHRHR